jgi:hypothetical protein
MGADFADIIFINLIREIRAHPRLKIFVFQLTSKGGAFSILKGFYLIFWSSIDEFYINGFKFGKL